MTIFGDWRSWVLLLAVWISLNALTAIAFSLIARKEEELNGRIVYEDWSYVIMTEEEFRRVLGE